MTAAGTAAHHGTRAAGDGGSVTVELVVLSPLLILLALFVVGLGRLAEAELIVDDAAHQAARAASLARAPRSARAQATVAAQAVIDRHRASCVHLALSVDTSQLRPGGSVTTQVTCAVALSDLTGLGLPGHRLVTASFTSPVDIHRGIGS
jgi:Flp pilus assembly protein TadG